MKKRIGLIQKIIIFRMWLKQMKNGGLITSCSYCDSINIHRTSSSTTTPHRHICDGDDLTFVEYNATYRCENCGATATCREEWTKES